MADAPARRSALAAAPALPPGTQDGAALAIVERYGFDAAQVAALDGGEARACAAALGAWVGTSVTSEPGAVATAGASSVLWQGPRRWFAVAPGDSASPLAERLAALVGAAGVVTPLGHSRACLRLIGAPARDVLAKASGVELDRLTPGRCALTAFAHVSALIHAVDATPTFDLWIARSLARHVRDWLEVSTREFARTTRVEDAGD